MTYEEHAWKDNAACATIAPELWFPESNEGERAKSICNKTCPVRAQCLAWALSLPVTEDWGIAGGLSVMQRRRMRKRLKERAA